MKKITLLSLVLVATMAFIGCETTDNTNGTKINGNMIANNTAVVKNDNTDLVDIDDDKELTRADFDKDRAKYEADAKENKGTYGTGANDLWLWTKTRSALLAADDIRESTINVDVTNDIVTLKGTVGTPAEKTKAEEVAKGIEGVKSVKNELRVDAKDSMTNQMTAPDKDDKMGNTNKTK